MQNFNEDIAVNELDSGAYQFSIVASLADQFVDFAPYVPAINDDGVVAFQACEKGGESSVFVTTENGIIRAADFADYKAISHPDISNDGVLCCYAESPCGEQFLCRIESSELHRVVQTGKDFTHIGPLGPTMNDGGAIAFRGVNHEGKSGVFVHHENDVSCIAVEGNDLAEFFGLPVVVNCGDVLYRANLAGGAQGAYLSSNGIAECIAETDETTVSLSLFPTMNNSRAILYCVRLSSEESRLIVVKHQAKHIVAHSGAKFESIRGGLISDSGDIVLFATPFAGSLGIYGCAGGAPFRLIEMGQQLMNSTVVDFALNPVSINANGDFVLRVRLADDRQFIMRGRKLPSGIQ